MSDPSPAPEAAAPAPSVVFFSQRKFVIACAVVAAALVAIGRATPMPVWLLAVEVFATLLGLFLFGSFKSRLHKNALTFGMGLVIVATFTGIPGSESHREIAEHGWGTFLRHNFLSFHGLD